MIQTWPLCHDSQLLRIKELYFVLINFDAGMFQRDRGQVENVSDHVMLLQPEVVIMFNAWWHVQCSTWLKFCNSLTSSGLHLQVVQMSCRRTWLTSNMAFDPGVDSGVSWLYAFVHLQLLRISVHMSVHGCSITWISEEKIIQQSITVIWVYLCFVIHYG